MSKDDKKHSSREIDAIKNRGLPPVSSGSPMPPVKAPPPQTPTPPKAEKK